MPILRIPGLTDDNRHGLHTYIHTYSQILGQYAADQERAFKGKLPRSAKASDKVTPRLGACHEEALQVGTVVNNAAGSHCETPGADWNTLYGRNSKYGWSVIMYGIVYRSSIGDS